MQDGAIHKNDKSTPVLFGIDALTSLAAELLFIMLPFVVFGIIFTYKGEQSKLAYMPEWSLAASVLFGQALVKYVAGVLGSRFKFRVVWERIAFFISLILVSGLIPSILVLTLILTTSGPSDNLANAQIGLFGYGLVLFLLFGSMGQSLIASKEKEKKEQIDDKRVEASK